MLHLLMSITCSFPGYHPFQIADAVVVARQLKATLVIPDIRGSEPGDRRYNVASSSYKWYEGLNRKIIILLENRRKDLKAFSFIYISSGCCSF